MEAFPTRMLLATDGSEDAGRAALAAVDISKRTGSELHVVHVLPQFPRYAYPGITPEIYSYVLDSTLREAHDLLDEQAKRIEDGGGRVAQTHTRRGPAADEILDLAEELGAGLIVVGSRGLGPVRHLVLGSVSEGVVHGDASCPVLVMRGGPDAWPPQRVVVGDDGSEIAKGAGELATRIGQLLDAKVLLMRAYPRLPEIDAEGRGFDARMIDDELRREERVLEERAAEIADASGTTRPRIRIDTGGPADALLGIAEEDTPEKTLLAVGSRGLDATQRIRLGSVSTKVLHAAKGPVLVYPRPKN
jgi:nucleotide-binding universal stress UspA family protein